MLYEQIQSNKRKTVFFLILFFLFIQLIGAAVGYYLNGDAVSGILMTSIFGIAYMAIMIYSSQSVVMRMNHAVPIKNKSDHPFLWNTVENLSMVARIPMPKIYIIQEHSPNAFATGISPNKASVAVTTALLEKLNREEIEAVIAHEIAHIKNYDVRLATILLALVSVVAIISDMVTHWYFFSRRDRDNKNPIIEIGALLLLVFSPIIAYMMQLAVSRNREYLADATGSELCRNPWALASALEKISSDPDPVDNIPASAASLYITDPLKKELKRGKRGSGSSLFSTHPPVEKRLERLRSM